MAAAQADNLAKALVEVAGHTAGAAENISVAVVEAAVVEAVVAEMRH